MRPDPARPFLEQLLVAAQVIEPDGAPSAADASAPPTPIIFDRPELPWHWPVGSRRSLAALVLIATAVMTHSSQSRRGADQPTRLAPTLVLDANTAPARVLGALPHVGPALVRQWTSTREALSFRSLEDLQKRVKGLGPVGMSRIAPHVRIDQPMSLPATVMMEQSSDDATPKKRAARRKSTRRKTGARAGSSDSAIEPKADPIAQATQAESP